MWRQRLTHLQMACSTIVFKPMSEVVNRILGEGGRFADILGLTSARCQSSDDGSLLTLKTRFNRAERPELGISEFHYILRDIPKEFRRRILWKTVVMVTIRGAAELTFQLEPDI